MKKIFLSLIAIVLIGFNTFAQDEKIGEDRNGEFVITANLDYVLKAWNDVLIQQKIDTKLETLDIRSGRYENSGGEYFMLVAYNSDNSTKVACMINRVNGNFLLREGELKTTVTCKGCTQGCRPECGKDDKGWKCSDPCSTCEKTETISY